MAADKISEFRAVSNEAIRRRDRWIRLTVWSTIPLLLVTTFVGVYAALSSSPHVYATFKWFAVLIVVGAIVGAYFLGNRLSIERLERDMVFVLTEKDVIRRRTGYPDIRIGFSEIGALLERNNWLVVESIPPIKKTAIPRGVEGFAALRAELAKHCAVVKRSHM
jgi:hypothetical protein